MRYRVNSVTVLVPNFPIEKHEDVEVEVSLNGNVKVYCKPLPRIFGSVPFFLVGAELIPDDLGGAGLELSNRAVISEDAVTPLPPVNNCAHGALFSDHCQACFAKNKRTNQREMMEPIAAEGQGLVIETR